MAIYNKDIRVDADRWYPSAAILPYGGSTAPNGWLLCDGASYSGNDYPELYAAIGTLYGVAIGDKGFKVPDLRTRFVEGASSTSGHTIGSAVAAALPTPNFQSNSTGAHTHTFTGTTITGSITANDYALFGSSSITNSGCLSVSDYSAYTASDNSQEAKYPKYMNFDATPSGTISSNGSHTHTISYTSSETIYGKSTTVQPPSICLNYIIRC